jgi:Tfp pilus assembly protein PilV
MGSSLVIGYLRSLRSAVGREDGFTLVESMMAVVLLVMVGTSLSGVLASAVANYSSSRERTLAEQLAQDQIEAMRRIPFSQVGLPNGNPSCAPCPSFMVASRDIDVTGLHATMKLQITYVDDQTPNSYRTYANYKKIVVTVLRDSDSKQLTKEVTYLSAAAKNAATESVITALVLDFSTNLPLQGATVNLGTGPSAPRTDITDASGKAVFPALTANPVTGGQAYYDLTVTPPFGYTMLKDDLPPNAVAHHQLGVAEPWGPTPLRAYKPSTVDVNIAAPPVPVGTTTPIPYTLSIGSTRGSEAIARPANTVLTTVNSVAGELVPPLPQYTVGAHAVNGSGSSATYWFATAQQKPVPRIYPTDPGQSFAVTGAWLNSTDVRQLTVKVQNASGTALGNIRVAISGGPALVPAPGVYIAGVTATSGTGTGTFTVMVPNGSGYTITAWGPTASAQLTGQSVTGTVTKTITVS